ncbi:MAG TPA: hypothetical protein VKT28_06965 [Puia sp.]|nr:hypothetical protein [Puia sp.]
MIKIIIFFLLLTNVLSSCLPDKRMGRYGTSDNISKSKEQNLYRAIYKPDKFQMQLLDSSIIKIDTGWAEAMWSYDKNGQPIIAEQAGYNFVIPIVKQEFEKFLFIFTLADTSNRASPNGIEEFRCVLNPKRLSDTFNILLEQKNPDTTYGWTKPLIYDTIKFFKITN